MTIAGAIAAERSAPSWHAGEKRSRTRVRDLLPWRCQLVVAVVAVDHLRIASGSIRGMVYPARSLRPAITVAVGWHRICARPTWVGGLGQNVARASIGIERLRETRHRDGAQNSRDGEGLLHALLLLTLLEAHLFAFPFPSIALVNFSFVATDHAPTRVAIIRSAIFAYLLRRAGT